MDLRSRRLALVVNNLDLVMEIQRPSDAGSEKQPGKMMGNKYLSTGGVDRTAQGLELQARVTCTAAQQKDPHVDGLMSHWFPACMQVTGRYLSGLALVS